MDELTNRNNSLAAVVGVRTVQGPLVATRYVIGVSGIAVTASVNI